MPPRILHIIPGLPTGGAERALLRLTASATPGLFHHVVLSLGHKEEQRGEFEARGIEVRCLGMRSVFSFPKKLVRFRKTTAALNASLIHGWMYHGGLAALVSGSGAPKVLGIRHSLHDISKETPALRMIIKLLAWQSRRFDVISYNSQASRLQHEAIGFAAHCGMVLPNGFDTVEFAPDGAARAKIRQELRLGNNCLVFGHVARYHPMKNHEGMIRAFSRLSEKMPQAKLLMAGQGVDVQNLALTGLISELGLGKNVFLLGERSDIPDLINSMDVLVSPSSWGEAFPNVIGEAMACGLPCVATDVGDSAPIIGNTGLVCAAGDTPSLFRAIETIALMGPEKRTMLGEKARQRIEEHYSQRQVTGNWEAIYRSLTLKANKTSHA